MNDQYPTTTLRLDAATGDYVAEGPIPAEDILYTASHIIWSKVRGETLTDPHNVRKYLATRLHAFKYEVFACLFLDNRHRVIAFEELFRGTIDGAAVYPREIVRRVLEHNAAAVIFAHNHPSGSSEPSHADRALTSKLCDALKLIDVRVLDHFVVGDGEPVSFAERGLI